MVKNNWNSRTKQELIIEVWEYLDCESVGSRELEQIQKALREHFGEGASSSSSPASIARTVADEGAVLRHPEVFECDRRWREDDLKKWALLGTLDFSDLSSAFAAVVELEERRLQLHGDSEAEGLKNLRQVVAAIRKDLLLKARSKILDDRERAQLKEVSHWLTVWLQSPELFSDWLDLRRRSPEFRRRFETD